MKNSDIATIELSQLFSGLTSLAENNRKSAAGRARGKKKPPLPQDKRPLVFRTRWTNEAVVMHTTISDCACCGHQFTVPSPLLLRRTNAAVGTHFKAMQPGEIYPDLPHETIPHYEQVQACHLCFPLTQAVEHLQATDQLALPLPFPKEDKYLTPPPPPEGRPEFTQPRVQPFVEYTPQRGAHHRPNDPEQNYDLHTPRKD